MWKIMISIRLGWWRGGKNEVIILDEGQRRRQMEKGKLGKDWRGLDDEVRKRVGAMVQNKRVDGTDV
jgi:hypothetical protein